MSEDIFLRFTGKGNFRHRRQLFPGGGLVPFTKAQLEAEKALYEEKGQAFPFEDPGDQAKRALKAAADAEEKAIEELAKAEADLAAAKKKKPEKGEAKPAKKVERKKPAPKAKK